MSQLAPYANNIYMEWVVGKTSAPATGTRYLTFTDKLFALGGVEVMLGLTGSANRFALTPATYFTQAAADSIIKNSVNINITTNCPTTTSVAFGAASLWDAISGGNMLAETPLQPRTLYSGDTLIVFSNTLILSIG